MNTKYIKQDITSIECENLIKSVSNRLKQGEQEVINLCGMYYLCLYGTNWHWDQFIEFRYIDDGSCGVTFVDDKISMVPIGHFFRKEKLIIYAHVTTQKIKV